MDVRAYNRDAWNREVDGGKNRWTQPVSHEIIEKARQGEFGILLTENIPVPRRWFPPLHGAEVLCLASGGGQQGPILAAAGAKVTVFDNSPSQLKRGLLENWLKDPKMLADILGIDEKDLAKLSPEELIQYFLDRLKEQTEAHHGGNKGSGQGGPHRLDIPGIIRVACGLGECPETSLP